MQHLPHENRVLGADPLQNPTGELGRPPPRGPKSEAGKIEKIAFRRSWGVLGSLLVFFWSFFAALGCFLRRRRPPTGLRGRFSVPCWLHFGPFSLFFQALFGLHCAVRFPTVLSAVFSVVSGVLGCARNKAEERKSTHPPRENVFFQGARPRPRRRKGDNRRPKKTPNIRR